MKPTGRPNGRPPGDFALKASKLFQLLHAMEPEVRDQTLADNMCLSLRHTRRLLRHLDTTGRIRRTGEREHRLITLRTGD